MVATSNQAQGSWIWCCGIPALDEDGPSGGYSEGEEEVLSDRMDGYFLSSVTLACSSWNRNQGYRDKHTAMVFLTKWCRGLPSFYFSLLFPS